MNNNNFDLEAELIPEVEKAEVDLLSFLIHLNWKFRNAETKAI